MVTGSRRHVSRHPCYWNTPYTCYTAAATHGYSYDSNSSFLTTPGKCDNVIQQTLSKPSLFLIERCPHYIQSLVTDEQVKFGHNKPIIDVRPKLRDVHSIPLNS